MGVAMAVASFEELVGIAKPKRAVPSYESLVGIDEATPAQPVTAQPLDPTGMVEAFDRLDTEGMFPAAQPGDFGRAVQGYVEGVKEDPFPKLGPIGVAIGAQQDAKVLRATQHLADPNTDWQLVAQQRQQSIQNQRGMSRLVPESEQEFQDALTASTPQAMKVEAESLVADYAAQLKKMEEGGLAKQTGRIMSAMPSWMLDFAITGGAGKLTSTTTKRFLRKTVKNRVAARVGSWVAEAGARTAVSPHRVAANTIERQLNRNEDFPTAFVKGWASTAVEYGSESLGGTLVRGGLSKAGARAVRVKLGPLGQKLLPKIAADWVAAKPGRTIPMFVNKMFKRGGFDGIIGEMLEERAATVLHGAIGTETYGLPPDASFIDRSLEGLKQDFTNTEDLTAEGISFFLLGAGRAGLGQAARGIQQAQQRGAAEQIRERYQRAIGEPEFVARQARLAPGELEAPETGALTREVPVREPTPTGLREAQGQAAEKVEARKREIALGPAEGSAIAQKYTRMEEVLDDLEKTTDEVQREELLDEAERIDRDIEDLSNLGEMDIKGLRRMARKMGVEVPKGASATAVRKLLGGSADLSQIEKTDSGYEVKRPIADNKAGRGFEIRQFDSFAEAAFFLEESVSEQKPPEGPTGQAVIAEKPKGPTPAEPSQAPTPPPPQPEGGVPRAEAEAEAEAPTEAPAEAVTSENIDSKLASLSKDAKDRYQGMLGTQPQPGQEVARFDFERAPGKALDLQNELLSAGLIEKIPGINSVRPIAVAPAEAAVEGEGENRRIEVEIRKDAAPSWLKGELLEKWANDEVSDLEVIRTVLGPALKGAELTEILDPDIGVRVIRVNATDFELPVTGTHEEAVQAAVEEAEAELEQTKSFAKAEVADRESVFRRKFEAQPPVEAAVEGKKPEGDIVITEPRTGRTTKIPVDKRSLLSKGETVTVGGTKYRIEETDTGWVVKETEGKFTTTHGGAGPGDRGQWSKEQALDRAMQKIGPAPGEKAGEKAGEKKKLEQPPKKVVESTAEVKPDERKEDKAGPGRTGRRGEEPLEGVPSEPVQKPSKPGGAVRPAVPSGGKGEQLHPEGDRRGDGLSRSEGSSTDDVDTSSRLGTSSRKSEARATSDYRITEADRIGTGAKKAKFKANLAAIKLLKKIESENRLATPEEQAILVKYVGWGGIVEAVPTGRIDENWEKEVARLKAALTDEEYKDAKASAPNAHYTSFETIGGIWEGLVNLGVAGGRINEPSMGVGHFFGLMPDKVAASANLYGGELDSLTGRIAQQLYQSAKIQIKGFEKTTYPDNYFDLFISNVPFGNYAVFDPEMRKFKGQIHDFFFIKALNKTRPGGLVVFITSKGTMDKLSTSIRSQIASQADLIGAIRLPKTAFKENAGTEVVADIIILQKRDTKAFPAGEEFRKRGTIKKAGEEFKVNEYFVRNPKNILGTLSYTGSQYGPDEMTVEPKRGLKLGEEITRIISDMKLTEAVDARQQAEDEARNRPDYATPAPDHVKEDAYVIVNEKLRQNRMGTLIPTSVGKAATIKIKSMVRVRDAMRDLVHKQLDPAASDAEVEIARKKLNTAYNKATKERPLSDPHNQRLFRADPDLPMLLSLEKYDRKTKKASKAAIFTKRTQSPYKPIEHADSADQALVASLNAKGQVDLDYMSTLLGEPIDKVIVDLEGRIFFDPAETKWVPADQYLSGNVRSKLAEAKVAAEQDPTLKPNVKALEEVQPDDISALDIDARLGASWVEEEDYLDFYKQISESSGLGVTFRKSLSTGTWVVSGVPGTSTQLNVVWGTKDVGALRLMELAMNQKQPKVTRYAGSGKPPVVDPEATAVAASKMQALKDEFKRWLWSDMSRADRLAVKYNEMFNNVVFPTWDGSHLELPGKVDAVKMRPYQLDAVWRFLSQGNTMLAHVVGAGKTYTGIASAMEARRLGRAKKPIFVVPNHLVTQWRDAWLELYPSATILAATSKDFEPKKRQTLMNKILTGDWDGIIVPETSFEKIPMSPPIAKAFFDEELDALEREILAANADNNKNLTKELEKAKKRLETSLQKQEAKWKKDRGPYYDEMGIDMMFVDEAHGYKNLFFRTQMTRVAGIQQKFVDKSFDMEQKTRFLNRTTDNKGLIFATGTPITNTIGEMYTMQRYLQPQALKAAGIESFDFWAQAFGESVTGVEITPEGKGFRVNTRFSKFTNLPELMQMYRMITDIQTQKMIKIKVPKVKSGKPILVKAPQTPELKALVNELADRATAIRGGQVNPKVDNMLRITGEGRKAALDLRLVKRATKLDPTGKVNMAIDKVFEIWQRTTEDKGAQVVWIDLSTPKAGRKWSIYDDVKNGLIERGVPAKEIAFVHDYKIEQLTSLYDDVNEGKIRVVVASTGKMGTGANIQERLIAAHHLDAPWRPADIEQRNGRIVRPGNMYDEVELYYYVTQGSFDAYMWQLLESKQKFIEQLMSGESTTREMEDLGRTSFTYAEVKAVSADNPKIMEAVQLDSEVKTLQAIERAHRENQFRLRRQHAELPERIAGHNKYIEAHRADEQKYSEAKEAAGKNIDIVIAGEQYDNRKEAGEALNAHLVSEFGQRETDPKGIGSVYGFPMTAKWYKDTHTLHNWKTGERTESPGYYKVLISGDWSYLITMEDSPIGNIGRILNALARIEDETSFREAELKRDEKEVVNVAKQIGKPFEKEGELKDKIAQLATLHAELQIGDKGRAKAAATAEAQEAAKPEHRRQRLARHKDIRSITHERFESDPTEEGPAKGKPAFAGVAGRPGGKKKKPWLTSKRVASPDEDIENFFGRTQRAPYNRRAETLMGKVRAGLKERFVFTPHIPQGAKYAIYSDMIRTMPEERRAAREQAVRDIIAVLNNDGSVQALDSNGLDLLRRKVFVQDILHEAEIDRSVAGDLDLKALEAEDKRLDELIAAVPSVQKAFEGRQELWKSVSEDLLERGVLDAESAKNQAYVRHFVLDLAEKNRPTGFLRKRLSEPYRAYSKHRKGSRKDISTDYLAVETQALADIYADNAVEDVANQIAELANKRKLYAAKAKSENFTKLVGGRENVRRIETLRGMIAESRAMGGQDSAERQQRKQWIEELTDLDPTYPYRKRIAMHMSKFRKASGFAPGEEDLDEGSALFADLARAAKEEAQEPRGMAARGVFKAMAERTKMIRDALGDAYVSAEKVAERDGYVEWHYKRPNLFYRAHTLTESQIAALVESSAEEVGGMLNIPVDQLRQALVMGRRKGWIIPDWLAAQLDDLPVNKRSGYIVRSFSRPFTMFWKRMILRINALRYNFRNLLGDSERFVVSGQEHALPKIPDAVKALITKEGEYYQLMTKRGVVNSSLWHEMNDVSKIKEFEKFRKFSQPKTFKAAAKRAFTAPIRAASYIGSVEQTLTQFREDILRAAVFIANYERLKADKSVRHWAGKVAEINEIAKVSKSRAAAKISRETLGDYGRFTPFENDVLRQGLVPFYSWMRINTLFWPRVLASAAREGTLGKSLTAAAPRAGLNIATWVVRALWIYGAMYLWNHRDDEAVEKESKLPFWLRSMPHVNLEKHTIWGQTALSDFVEWGDMESLAGISWRYDAGFLTKKEAALEVARVIAQSPVNKVYQALNPFMKAPITAIAGVETFPSVFDPHFVAAPASRKSLERAILGILGSDAKKFYQSAKGDRKLEDTLYAYFAGWWARPTDPQTLIDEIRRTKQWVELEKKSKTTGRLPGMAKKGREAEFQEMLVRKGNKRKKQ